MNNNSDITNQIKAEVESSVVLTDVERKNIEKFIRREYPNVAEVIYKTIITNIGGFKVKAGGFVVDMTLKNELAQLVKAANA